MTGHNSPGKAQTAPAGLMRGCAWLAVAALGCYVLIGSLASQRYGNAGWISGGIATLVCAVAAMVSLAWFALTRGTFVAVHALLGGTALRLLLPMAAAIALPRVEPTLATAGFTGCLLGSFLILLTVETVLLVRLARTPADATAARVTSKVL